MKFKIVLILCMILAGVFLSVTYWETTKKEESIIAQEKPLSEPVTKIKSEPVKIIFEDENDFIEVTDRLSFIELPEAGVLDDPDLTVGVTGVEWASYVPITKFIIENDKGEEIGVLDWSTGKLEFSGKMSCSARSFLKYFLKQYVDDYIAEELDKKDEIIVLPEKGADSEDEILVITDFNEIIAIWHDIWKLAYTWQGLDAGTSSSFWMNEEIHQRVIIAGEFIEWLYENDYKIVKKEGT